MLTSSRFISNVPFLNNKVICKKQLINYVLHLIVCIGITVAVTGCGGQISGGNNANNSGNADPNSNLAIDTSFFSQTVYPLVVERCSACHSGSGPGAPNFTHPDLQTAYDATVLSQKVNLKNPINSRLVQRLVTDSHFCWSTDCIADGNIMTVAIQQWATLLANAGGGGGGPTGGKIFSASVTFASAQAGGTARINTDVIALWEFKEGTGNIAQDTSGIAPAIDLTLMGAQWIGGGVEISAGKLMSGQASKLYNSIADPNTGTNEYTVETWITPANTSQDAPGGTRIVSYSISTSNRNFTMGQSIQNYRFRNRSGATNSNGNPALLTANGEVAVSLQHVVMTYDQQSGRKIYVNGQDTGVVDGSGPGGLANWNSSYSLQLGNEQSTNQRQWMGQIHLVAIHKRALTAAQVAQNFDAGVAGTKLILSFDISSIVGAPDSFIEIEAGDFDSFSYVFSKPTFVTSNPNNIRVKNLRISINDTIPAAGQTFRNVDTTINTSPQELSRLGAVIAKEQGIDTDQIALAFEILGDQQDIVVEPVPNAPPSNIIASVSPEFGIKTFESISESMAAVTGVDPNSNLVKVTFDEIKEQLPSLSNLGTFASSHQVSVAKLSLEFCNELVESPTLRTNFFGNTPSFEFDLPVTTAFSNQIKKDLIIQKVVDNILGVNLASQPTFNELQPELNSLISDLTLSCNVAADCDAVQTRAVVKAVCAAVLGSAGLLIQ